VNAGLVGAAPRGFDAAREQERAADKTMAELRVRSEIAGSVWKIEVAIGDTVAEDDPLLILESMKMEIPLLSPRAGVVKEILVAEGEPIAEGVVAVILA
jgi:acetyl-CoA carboxylase biotin carboxyl carrier protein